MSKFKVGDKVRALANPTSKSYSNDGYFKVGEEFTVKEVFPVQGTVSLVERGQCWDESRFELVEEAKPFLPPNTSFKVGDKVRRKTDDLRLNDWSHGDRVLTVSEVDDLGGQQIIRFAGVLHGWDGFRFELVEPVSAAALTTPAVPQLPGIPEGYRAVRIGTPTKGEWYVAACGVAGQGDGYHTAKSYTILEKIDQPAPVEPPQPEALAGSPNDLVIQDRVPSRAGTDFGWWVSSEEFDRFQPTTVHTWKVGTSRRDGLMHGYKHEVGSDRLAVMCYRKDLPVLPIAERVVLDEYLVWDTDGPKYLLWGSSNPTIETASLDAWDHAYPTGNTREIEVPIVKP